MGLRRLVRAWAAGVAVVALGAALAGAAEAAGRRTVAEVLAGLQVPPDWFATTEVTWDTSKPWQDARLEIRRLLALDEAHVRQGAKLTWLYAQKGDIGDGHELPMYMFMSGNYAWALREYPPYLQTRAGKGATHGYLCYAACLAHFGDYEAALAVLAKALTDLPPAPWRTNSEANIHSQYGDLYARMGDQAKAREHYAEAIRLYPLSDQPYGRHLLPRKVAQIETKLRMLTVGAIGDMALRDGTYTGSAMGYGDKVDIVATVVVRDHRIADVSVTHQEKIELGATRIIPQRIVEKQSLEVDAVTGATVTSQGIVEAAYRALLQAGLK